jgi:hypothetical protein
VTEVLGGGGRDRAVKQRATSLQLLWTTAPPAPLPRCKCYGSSCWVAVATYLESVAVIMEFEECDWMRWGRRSTARTQTKERERERERERRVKNRDKEIELWQRVWSPWRGQWSFEECDWMCCSLWSQIDSKNIHRVLATFLSRGPCKTALPIWFQGFCKRFLVAFLGVFLLSFAHIKTVFVLRRL